METVRILLLGAGGMGRYHLKQLLKLPEVEIAGLVDPAEASIAATFKQFPDLAGTPTFTDYRQALEAVAADAALIVTPHSEHFEQGMACIEAGLHVLMEKPFVSGSQNAERLIEAAGLKSRHLAVSYQRHVEGPFVYLRDLVQSGALGTVRFVAAYQAQAWLQGTRGTWRQNPVISHGGQLNDSGSHLLDVVLWLTGLEAAEVSATIENRGAPVDVDSVVSIRFKGGAIASFNIIGSASLHWHEDVSVHGDKGSALYRNGTLAVAREGEKTATHVPADALPESSTPDKNFVDLLLGRVAEPAAPAACGLLITRVTEAAMRSAETGRWVSL